MPHRNAPRRAREPNDASTNRRQSAFSTGADLLQYWQAVPAWIRRLVKTGAVLALHWLAPLAVLGYVALHWQDRVPLWVLAAGVVAWLLGKPLFRRLWRRLRPPRKTREETALDRVTQYLLVINDVLTDFKEALPETSVVEVRETLTATRSAIFAAITEGVQHSEEEVVRCAFFMLRQTGSDEYMQTATGWHHGHSRGVKNRRLHMTKSTAGMAYTTNELEYQRDVRVRDARFQRFDDNDPMRSLICAPAVPASLGGKPLGVLSVSSSRIDAFNDSDQIFVNICASAIGAIRALLERLPSS